MKFTLILVTLLHFMPNSLWGQKVSVTSEYGDTLYLCIYNPLHVISIGTPSLNISLYTNNGKITRNDSDSPDYYIYPIKDTKTTLYISKVEGTDTISCDSFVFNIKRVPHSGVAILGEKGGHINKTKVCIATGITVRDHPNGCFTHTVHSYRLKVIRSKDVIFDEYLSGPRFSNRARGFFSQLLNNDVIKIEDVNYVDCDSTIINIKSPISFTITNSKDYGILRKGPEYTSEDTFRNLQTGKLFLRIWTEDVLTGEIFKDSIEIYQVQK